jgi:hypothetical protein
LPRACRGAGEVFFVVVSAKAVFLVRCSAPPCLCCLAVLAKCRVRRIQRPWSSPGRVLDIGTSPMKAILLDLAAERRATRSATSIEWSGGSLYEGSSGRTYSRG